MDNIEESKLNEERLESLLRINNYSATNIQEFLDFALNEAINLTKSKLGYIYLYNEETKEFTLNTWSKEVMQQCNVTNKQTTYTLDKTGIWGEAVRERKPIIINDFNAPHQKKKGLPEGHAPLNRFLTVPVFHKNKIVAVVGVANKINEYNNSDIRQLTLMMDSVWKVVERKKAEELIYENEEKFRTLFNTMLNGVVYQDEFGKIISANPAAQKILGLTLDQMQGRTSLDPRWKAIRPDGSNFPGDEHPIVVALKTGKEVNNVIHGVFHPEKNSHVWIKVNAVPLFRPGENIPYQAYATFEDITQQKKTEQDLKDSEYLLNKAQEIAQMGSWSLDIINNKLTWSDEIYRLFGLEKNEFGATYQAFEERIHPNDRDAVNNAYAESKKACIENGIDTYKIEHRIIQKNTGKTLHVIEICKHIKDALGNITHSIGTVHNITERKQLEAEREKTEHQQNQMQKLESIGVLAGGIAHDFNNLMGGIFGYIEIALNKSTNQEVVDYLSKSMGTIDRARALTAQLITFAKGGAPIQKIGYLFPFIQETVKFALSGSNVSCNFNIPNNLWACNFDKNQIGQVIDNLIINAQQAMPNGGTIELSASNLTLEKNNISVLNDSDKKILATNNYVKISIKDAGVGIPKDIIAKIFDPFFTTKSKGHGLGLATCYSIINRHGGFIDVESQPGAGSTFIVYLPANTNAISANTKKLANVHKGNGNFLVMDDEEVIRDTLKNILTEMGYNVVCKNNGQDAFAFFFEESNAKRSFAGIILDLTVPGGMGGKETVAQIRKMNPNVSVFVASGYADDPVIKNPVEYGFTASIIKPFLRAELARMLNKYL